MEPERLDREFGPRGTEAYAKEELRAEIGSMMLEAEIGIPHSSLENHAAYVASWITVLEDDPRELFRAAADAERILEYVVNLEQTREQTTQIELPQEPVAAKEPELAQERRYLAVPYLEHREAKAAGAAWDPAAKLWYAGPKANLDKLQKWLPERDSLEQVPALSPREEFSKVLQGMGFIMAGEHPVMDGTTHRMATEGDTQGLQSGFYVAYTDGRPAGYAKNNRTGEEIRWKSAGNIPGQQEQATFREIYARKRQEREEALHQAHEATSRRVTEQWASMSPIQTPTPYMASKKIQPHPGIRTIGNGQTTCIPAEDINGQIWTMQYIQADGTKRFAKQGRKEGCFHPVGGREALEKAPVLVICEGYATACTISEALGFATVAAFDAGNMTNVAEALHQKYPDKPVIIAGDNDKHLVGRTGHNPGQEKAQKAAQATGGTAVFPVFAPGEQGRDFSDFNDLAVKSTLGTDAVRRQLAPIVTRVKEQKMREKELSQQQTNQTTVTR